MPSPFVNTRSLDSDKSAKTSSSVLMMKNRNTTKIKPFVKALADAIVETVDATCRTDAACEEQLNELARYFAHQVQITNMMRGIR